jgi:hypothetical protein
MNVFNPENHINLIKIMVQTISVENNNATHTACRKSNTQGDAVGFGYIALTGRGAVLRAESPAYPSPTAPPWVIKTTKNQLRIMNYELRMKENHIKITVQTYPVRDYRSVERNSAPHPACRQVCDRMDASPTGCKTGIVTFFLPSVNPYGMKDNYELSITNYEEEDNYELTITNYE